MVLYELEGHQWLPLVVLTVVVMLDLADLAM
jgi:hypothetical protein